MSSTEPVFEISRDIPEPEAWRRFVDEHPAGRWYHRPEWGAVAEAAYRMPALYVTVRRENALEGVCLLTRTPVFPWGHKLTAGAFIAHGGPLLRREADREPLHAFLRLEARRTGERAVELRERIPPGELREGDIVTLACPLAPAADAHWQTLDAKVRNQVRKGQKSNLSLRQGHEHVDALHAVYSEHQRGMGTPTHARKFFREILARFPVNSDVLIVTLDRKPVGGMILFFDARVCVALSACSLREHGSLCVNHFMYWEAMRFAMSRSIPEFDFGRSLFGSGTCSFKMKWGATPMKLHYHDVLGDHVVPPTKSSEMSLAARAWRLLPAALANRLGPVLRRYLA